MRNILVLLLLIGTSLILGGPFIANVAAQAAVRPVMWGVDEDRNELFSVADYTQISSGAAAAGYINYGRLKYNRGTENAPNIQDLPLVRSPGTNRITGGHIGSIALDTQGVAYMAVNAGLEFDDPTRNLSAPVFLSFDTATANPSGLDVVKIVGQINIPDFDEPVRADNISGLSFDPLSGKLYALYRDGSKEFDPHPDKLLIVDPETAKIDPVFGIKEIKGKQGGQFEGQEITDGEDLEFDTAGNLYITDDLDDHLHLIDKSDGAIIGIVDDNETGGLSGSGRTKIEALAWDPELNQMVAVATLRKLFYIQTLQNGANIPLGGLPGLTDVEAIDFIIPGNPRIDIRKEAEGEDSRTFPSGSEVTFQIVVTNTGDVPLTNVVVTDKLTPECASSTIPDLAVTGVVSYECTTGLGVVTGFENEACVAANPTTNINEIVDNCDPSTVVISGIDIRKEAEGADSRSFPSGSEVTFNVVVTNTGDVPLTNVVVTDELTPECASSTIPDLDVNGFFSYECTTTSGVVTGFENIACANGMGNGVPAKEDCDPSTVLIASIDIEKATNGQNTGGRPIGALNDADDPNGADVPLIAMGDPIIWTYVVTNTGLTPFNEADVVVEDLDLPIGTAPVLVDRGIGNDTVLSPGEAWTYEATGVAADLGSPPAPTGITIVNGCETTTTPPRPTYENLGVVTVPGATDSDPSHYCNPPVPAITIEKATNEFDADGANDADVPQIAVGDTITWTYVVTNTGDAPFNLADVVVTDDIIGTVTNIIDQGNGGVMLSPGEIWIYQATGVAADLGSTPAPTGVTIVNGCETTTTPPRPTYENLGVVTVPGATDSDPSHYCNVNPGIAIEKATNGQDADLPDGTDVPQIAVGGDITWTYVVTNNGNAPFNQADVVVTDDVPGVNPTLVTASDTGGDGILSVGEVWTYEATGVALDLGSAPANETVVGCDPPRPTYTNLGVVTVPGATDSDPSHYCNPLGPDIDIEKSTRTVAAPTGDNVCKTLGKPGMFTLRYTGNNLLDHHQKPGSVKGKGGDLNGESPVRIISKDSFNGDLNIGDTFDTEKGEVIIKALNGKVLKEIEFHTSCSQPLALGDNYGGVQLVGFTSKDGKSETFDPTPGIGGDADDANGADVPQISPGDPVIWTYTVTNTGKIALKEVVVTDDQGITPKLDTTTDINGDGVLDVGEVWEYTASGVAEDLVNAPTGATVPGCGTPERPTYVNMGKVTAVSNDTAATPVEDTDRSHYCNPPDPGIDIEKYTKIGAAPVGGDVCDTLGKPRLLDMRYVGGNVEAHSQGSKTSVSGDPEMTGEVRIIVGKNFDGIVPLGERFVIDGRTEKLDSNTEVLILEPDDDTVLQTIEFHTSCSQPLHLGDRFGSIRLISMTDKEGNNSGTFDSTPDSDDGVDADEAEDAPEGKNGDGVTWTYIVTNTGKVDLTDIRVTDDKIGPVSRIVDQGNGDAVLSVGEVWKYRATGMVESTLYRNLGKVTGRDSSNRVVMDEDPSHYKSVIPQGDICKDKSKLQTITMRYTGDGAHVLDNSQSGKAQVVGDPKFAPRVHIISGKDEKKKDNQSFFDGIVELNGLFVIDARKAGEDKLESNTNVRILDEDGRLLQTIDFHTSCSKPLERGNRFGGIQLVDVTHTAK